MTRFGLLVVVVVVAIVALAQVAHPAFKVAAQDSGLQFPLDAVRKLADLLEGPGADLQSRKATLSICTHPSLPPEFLPVCKSKEAPSIFRRLRTIANDDLCELCTNAACTGCY
ncbi:guanylate cyclase activator 2B [Ornithorhynchus anatinus]|uniref:guanylate cyclase activator 2B n=1 Tax=Ornithorhynchus anatinus TaxID=9258 RepID=UPI0004541154|nr:guanylate cyclase activator 2B [Ornithorhynchus anatinus]